MSFRLFLVAGSRLLAGASVPVAIGASIAVACGGSVAGDSAGDGLDTADAGEQPGAGGSAGGARSAGGRVGAGGASLGAGGSSGGTPSDGGAPSVGGAIITSDGGGPACPIRVSKTYLTEEDCYACVIPGAPCESSPGLPSSIEITPEFCVNIIRMHSTLYCMWYADGDPFDQSWGAFTICDSTSGRVACGGGL